MFSKQITIDAELRLVEARHCEEIFAVVEKNRAHIRRWMPWVDATRSVDDVKKWQAGEYGKLIALRDQVAKVRQFAVATCENPQGAKPGQTKCPF